MKTCLLLALIVAVSFAVQLRPMTNNQINKFESLKKGSKWGSIMMNLAELHLQAQGPLDQLVDAIEEVIEDVVRKTNRANEEYQQRTNDHNSEVNRINGQIDNANEDISSTTELLENVLYVQRANLQQDIVNLNEGIESTQQHILDETELRNEQHANFNVVVAEHSEALSAVGEAIEVLSQLFEGASLLQVKKAQKSIEKVSSHLSNTIEGSLAKALLSLATSQFSDQSDVQKVNDLLNEIRGNLLASIENFTNEENQRQSSWETDMQNSRNQVIRFQTELSDATEALNQTNQSIEDNLEFLAQRRRDLARSQQDLVDENANFDRITELYEDLVAQLAAEEQSCYEALDVLQSGDIAGYIGGRMEQDVIISQPHGTGITVERNSFDLE